MCGISFEDKTKTLGSQDYPGSKRPLEVQSNLLPPSKSAMRSFPFHKAHMVQPPQAACSSTWLSSWTYIKSKPRVSICVFCFSKFIFSMILLVGTGRLLLCTLETFSSPCWTNLVRFSSWDFHPSVSVKSKQGTKTVTSSKQSPPDLQVLK